MSSAPAMSLPESAGRRRYARYELSVPFDLTVFRPGSVVTLSGEAEDVGEGGLRGMISGAALPGERVELTIALPSSPQPLNMRAVVRHEAALHCGFEFLSLEEGQREQLQQLAGDPGLHAALINEIEWEPGLAPAPRAESPLCPTCGQELSDEIPVCLTCGTPQSPEAVEETEAEKPVPSPAAKPAKKVRRAPQLDSIVAIVFLVTLSIGLWQWMRSPADTNSQAQPSPVTVELENVFLRPVPAPVAAASATANSRSSRVLSATKSFVSAVIGSASPSKPQVSAGAARGAAAESSRANDEAAVPTTSQFRSAPAPGAPTESAPAENASSFPSAPLAAPAPSSPANTLASAPANPAPSGSDLAGMLLQKVLPVYPDAARREGVQGQVVLKALIGKDGTIAELRPMQGPQQLTAAAIDAVQHWRFRPYEVKGKPVEVETDIRLNFELPNKK